jgi:hypothetical protein
MGKFIDLTGQRFGRLEVISPAFKDNYNKWHWNCKCDCGNEKIIRGGDLKSNKTQSCGCLRLGCLEDARFIDLTNMRFGKLLVMSSTFIGNKGEEGGLWLCKCDCGNEKIVKRVELRTGRVKSCGCAQYKSGFEHGLSRSVFASIRQGMMTRCYNPNSKDYHNYHDKNITVCDEWRDNPISFYKWGIASDYKAGLTLERIDNSKGYSPENCRWATHEEQANNKNTNRYITFNGEARQVKEWSKKLGIGESTIKNRLNQLNWTIEEALTTPVGSKKVERNRDAKGKFARKNSGGEGA